MAFLFKSSDIALKDFYFDLGRWAVVSTKCPNEKDLKWKRVSHRTGFYAQPMDGLKVIKTIRRENVNKVFDVPITAAARNDMPYRNSPVTTVVSPKPTVTPAPEKEAVYQVVEVTTEDNGNTSLGFVITKKTLKEAQSVAESFARGMPGNRYAVMQVLGIVQSSGVTWE